MQKIEAYPKYNPLAGKQRKFHQERRYDNNYQYYSP